MRAILVLGCLALASCGKPEISPAPATSAPAPSLAPSELPSASAPSPSSSSSSSPAPAPAPSDMLLVPGGPFTMGTDSGGEEDEHPAHTVTLAPFFLDKTEVSNSAWTECVAAKACRPKSDAVRTKHPDFDGPNQPVSGISWDDATAYCAWKDKRLPREAEFEKAARDTDDRRYTWGNDEPTHDRAVFSAARTEDVGTHPTGRGPYGHDDLAGNVWEWQQDEYDPYAYRRAGAPDGRPGACAEIMAAQDELRHLGKQGFTGTNPIPDECEHSIRGGAYNYDAHGLRATNRVHHPGRYRIPMLGLRCARDASPGVDAGASP
jgi:formylglycine-generating enzyme required for sulfatase activity